MKANITTDDEVVLFSSSIMVHDGNNTQYHHLSDGYPIRTMQKKMVQNINSYLAFASGNTGVSRIISERFISDVGEKCPHVQCQN